MQNSYRKFLNIIFFLSISLSSFGQNNLVSLSNIICADPYIYADKQSKTYILTGTAHNASCNNFWTSKDLKTWSGPYNRIDWDKKSWKGENPAIWAPEIHKYRGKYYCFATFTNNSIIHGEINGRKLPYRNTHIFVSQKPDGPYKEISSKNYFKANKCTLDGTLWVEPNGTPYMVYCYEWIQAVDGRMEVVKLKKNLKTVRGKSIQLFKASDGKWKNNQVTDGPFLFKTQTGKLGMLWSTGSGGKYVQGVAYSSSGKITGPWIQDSELLTPADHGHGMLFKTFDNKLMLVCHTWKYDKQGKKTTRYPVLFEMDDRGDKLKIIKKVSF